MIQPHRHQPLWYAFILHRISGICLAFFLPFHFYILGLALTSRPSMDGFLHWAELPVVKFAEAGLVFLLAVHLFGGLRLMALELLPWNPRQKTLAAVAISMAFFVACCFLMRSF